MDIDSVTAEIVCVGRPYCERCGEELNPATMVMLELDQNTGRYHRPGKLPEGHQSQGCFTFGAACARSVLRNGGENRQIRNAR